VLKDIYTNLEIGPFLGFKGGTAAYLFYNLSRFSVDLDFDLLDEAQGDFIFESVQKILEGYGLVREARKKRFSFFYLLSYANKIEHAYNIKVEINLRNFGSRYEVRSYLGISMKVMVQEDMVAHKLVAMYERLGTTNRDIFDTWFFLKNNWPINEKIIEKRTNMTMKEFLQKCINELESMSDRGILSGLGELLDAKQKIWAKEKLRTDTIFLLKMRLNS
jgi:predicted nucleotidyltransferase component of viral defense system